MKDFIKIDNSDNVVVALNNFKKGTILQPVGIELKDDIPFGHKIAITDIPKGGYVIKYGHRIGKVERPVSIGELVNETNLKTAIPQTGAYEYSPLPGLHANAESSPQICFNGYLRKNGDAGVRNELWIVPLVSCVNCVASELAKRFGNSEYAAGLDGVFSLTHPYGCSQLGCDHENTRKILAGLCKNPNAGGVLVLGLGCENNKMDKFKELVDTCDASRIRFLEAQSHSDELASGFEILKELAANMRSDKRRALPLSKLRVGLKCGGSDAFSGISANVLIGRFADMAIRRGASCALCEVPEMFGAETLLMERAISREVFDKIVDMINSFKSYFVNSGMPVYENPSPGNKAGGISTLEEKSLGCVQKGGKSPVMDVIRYAERIKSSGLTLLESPGNDPVATAALAAAGCQIILFSTGRGTPFASAVPTVKISSNTPLFEKKQPWIDFDAGPIVGGKNIDDISEEFFKFVIDVANGKKTKAELNGYREIAIFKNGVTL